MGQSGGGGGVLNTLLNPGAHMQAAFNMPVYGQPSAPGSKGGGAGPDIGSAGPMIQSLAGPAGAGMAGLSFGGTQPMQAQGSPLIPELLRYLQPTFR